MTRILSREGANPQVSVIFFKFVVQSVLFFGVDMWVVTPCMKQFMGVFQYQVAWILTGRLPRQPLDGKWK